MNDTANALEETVVGGQITEVKPDNALVVMDPEKYATELFAPFNAELATAKRRAGREKYDITTKEGMETAKDLRNTFVKLRTRADKTKTEAKRPIDIAGKAILARFNAFRDAAVAEENKHGEAITRESERREAEQAAKEAEQRAKTEAIEARIAHIRGIPAMLAQADSAALALKVEELAGKQIDPDLYPGAYLEDAVDALNATVDTLRTMHQAALDAEEERRRVEHDRAELEQLRIKQAAEEKRQREEAEERQRQADLERQQAADRQAAADKQMADMRAEQERQQAIMAGIQAIQESGMFDGDTRALLGALENAIARPILESTYGAMTSMAKMAKDMAISSIQGRIATRLFSELPSAHDEALDENHLRGLRMLPEPVASASAPYFEQLTGLPAPESMVESFRDSVQSAGHSLLAPMPGVLADEHPSNDSIEIAARVRPTLGGMLDVLADHYGETPATVLGWLRDLVVQA